MRLEKRILVASFWVVAVSMLLVCAVVFVPFSSPWRIAVLIAQSFVVGVIANITNVYCFTCLARGTTPEERAWALKYAFGFGPIAAVLGSLAAQLFLNGKVPGVSYPYNFGLLYLIGFPCMAVCALLSSRYRLPDATDKTRESFVDYVRQSVIEFRRNRKLVLVWVAYLFWFMTIDATPNVSLYTREVVGRSPMELAGIVMAVRFGCKALAGLGLGSFAVRYGAQRTMNATVLLAGAAMLWPFVSSGYGYLLAFGLLGAAELGGVYFPNFIVVISSAGTATRNLAILSLVTPLSSIAPVLYGALTDWLGFRASFLFGAMAAAVSLFLLMRVNTIGPERGPAAAR